MTKCGRSDWLQRLILSRKYEERAPMALCPRILAPVKLNYGRLRCNQKSGTDKGEDMRTVYWAAGAALMAIGMAGMAEQAAPLSALARMPVKEITVFKDGHAFVLHEGTMPVDSAGNVQMDYLPTPVLGTFWPYSAAKDVKLSAVIASPRRVLVERTALNLRELLDANPG